MKKLKDIVATAKEKILDYNPSFASMRKIIKPDLELDYDSSFAAFRKIKKPKDEEIKESAQPGETHGEELPEDYRKEHENMKEPLTMAEKREFFHPDILPTGKQIDSIKHFTQSGSERMNEALRNKQPMHYDDEDHDDVLQGMFGSHRMTNKEHIHTYSGLPPHAGERVEDMADGEVAHFPGYVSTSAHRAIAHGFAHRHTSKSSGGHMMKISISPHMSLHIAHHSEYPEEHEVLLNRGTKMRKIKTTYTAAGTKIHHMEVVP